MFRTKALDSSST